MTGAVGLIEIEGATSRLRCGRENFIQSPEFSFPVFPNLLFRLIKSNPYFSGHVRKEAEQSSLAFSDPFSNGLAKFVHIAPLGDIFSGKGAFARPLGTAKVLIFEKRFIKDASPNNRH
jgi:hypothetical protein